MAKIWRNRIIAGTQLYSNCPLRYKSDVEALLRADVENKVISVEKFTELTGLEY